jgi:hypothetical protein
MNDTGGIDGGASLRNGQISRLWFPTFIHINIQAE